MSIFISIILISIIAFASFCFYSGVSAIGEKLKKDGLYSVIEIAFIIFLATALVIIAVGKVNSLLFKESPIRSERVYNV